MFCSEMQALSSFGTWSLTAVTMSASFGLFLFRYWVRYHCSPNCVVGCRFAVVQRWFAELQIVPRSKWQRAYDRLEQGVRQNARNLGYEPGALPEIVLRGSLASNSAIRRDFDMDVDVILGPLYEKGLGADTFIDDHLPRFRQWLQGSLDVRHLGDEESRSFKCELEGVEVDVFFVVQKTHADGRVERSSVFSRFYISRWFSGLGRFIGCAQQSRYDCQCSFSCDADEVLEIVEQR